jgi:phosphoglycerate dehydrogenase-like enzyme
VEALRSGLIRAAVLDVFDFEPLPHESPLWDLPNAYVSPHHAAYSFPDDIVGIFVDNYRRFVAGQPLHYLIDFERGY